MRAAANKALALLLGLDLGGTRGAPRGRRKYRTRSSFVQALRAAFKRLHDANRNLADYSETTFARDWLRCSYPTYKAARDAYQLDFPSIVAAYERYRARQRTKHASK